MFGQGGQNNKVICRFYQRGDCKYGNNCFNIHQGVSGSPKTNIFGGGSSTSHGFSSYDNSNSNSSLQDNQFMEFVKQVTHEMKIWETNGLWPLSCLAPLKEHPLIAEFHDTSPEELRVEAYAALKMNNSASYEASYRQKLEYHKQLCEAIKNRNPSAIEALKSVFYVSGTNNSTPSSNSSSIFGKSSSTFLSSTSQPSVFGGSSNNTNKTTSVFGGSANLGANNIFGAKPTQNSVFGGAPVFGSSTSTSFGGGNLFKSTFGSGSGSNLFGGAANQSTTQNVFKNSSQGSLFGSGSMQQPQQTSSASIFGTNTTSNTAATNQNSNVFGTGTQNLTPSVFGGNAQQSSGFGSSGQFGANSSSAFGNPSIFSKNQSSSVFGSNSQANVGSSLFSNTPMKDNQSNVFGVQSSTSNANSIFGGNSNSNDQQQHQHQHQQPLNLSSGSSSSVFGSNFENKTATGLFSNSTSDKTSSIFGTTVSSSESSPFSYGLNKSINVGNSTQTNSGGNSIFGANSSNNANPISLFGTPKTSKEELSQQTSVSRNIFGNDEKSDTNTSFDNDQKNTTNTLFGSDKKNTMNALFGSDQKNSTNTLFGTAQNTASTVAEASKIYTPMYLLSLEDKNEFERDVFLRIPIVPPPKELCF